MKNSIIICCLALCLIVNLYSQNDTMDFTKGMYRPFTAESIKWMPITQNNSSYEIKVFCYDGIPYKGHIHANTTQTPINIVNYWDNTGLVQNSVEFELTNKYEPLLWCDLKNSFGTSIITIKDIKQITLYIVNAFTGDTIFTNYFPSPIVDTITAKRTKMSVAERELVQKVMGIDASLDKIIVEYPSEILTTTCILHSGLYFAYFVNTNDKKLRWVEKIVKP